MDWQAVAQTINSIGLLVVALYSTYLNQRKESKSFEEILFQKRINTAEQIHEHMCTTIEESEKLLSHSGEVDFNPFGSVLEKVGDMTAQEVGEARKEFLEGKREDVEDIYDTGGREAEALEQMHESILRLWESHQRMSRETVRAELFLPEYVHAPVEDFADEASQILLGEDRTSKMEEARNEFINRTKEAVGSGELNSTLKSRW